MSFDSSSNEEQGVPKRDLKGGFLALVRPRLLPSAPADVLAGAALGGGLSQVQVLPLIQALVAALLLYAGALCWNDVAGSAEDR